MDILGVEGDAKSITGGYQEQSGIERVHINMKCLPRILT